MNRKIYLDNNASTAADPKIIAHLTEFLPILQGNPSSTHSFGREAKSIVNGAREEIARYLKVKPAEIIFTSGGTEGSHIAIRALLAAQSRGHIICSETEHSCVYREMQRLLREGFEVTFLKPTREGCVDPEDLRSALRLDTRLIAIMSVNNETGVKNDIAAIAELARGKSIPLVVDGVAALGKESLHISAGVSAMIFSGHKIHVPAGIGFVYIRSAFQTKAARDQLGYDGNLRPGTENLLGIAALHKGIELLQETLEEDIASTRLLRDHFETILLKKFEKVTINGSGPRIGNVSNVCFHGVDGESLLIALDRQGVAASHGSACSSGALEPSRVLTAMGLPIADVRSSIRFSLSRMTTREEIDAACRIIIDTTQAF